MPKPTYYHASPRRFRHGDLLTGGHAGGYGVAHPCVCMTDSPAPHGTILSRALGEDWFVYEVLPAAKVHYCESNQEFQAASATVVRMVGRARALAAKRRPGAVRCDQTGAYFSMPRAKPRRGVKALILRPECSARWGLRAYLASR